MPSGRRRVPTSSSALLVLGWSSRAVQETTSSFLCPVIMHVKITVSCHGCTTCLVMVSLCLCVVFRKRYLLLFTYRIHTLPRHKELVSFAGFGTENSATLYGGDSDRGTALSTLGAYKLCNDSSAPGAIGATSKCSTVCHLCTTGGWRLQCEPRSGLTLSLVKVGAT